MTPERKRCLKVAERHAEPSTNDLLGWLHVPHDADIGVVGYGPTPRHAFEQAAIALTAAITDEPIDLAGHVLIFCRAADIESLLIEWLNAITYKMAVHGMIFGDYAVCISGDRLCGAAYGELIDQKKHLPACEVKGATYTELSVRTAENGLCTAQCVIDV